METCIILSCNKTFIMRYHDLVIDDLGEKAGNLDIWSMFIMGGEL